jgi:hypothetical protein
MSVKYRHTFPMRTRRVAVLCALAGSTTVAVLAQRSSAPLGRAGMHITVQQTATTVPRAPLPKSYIALPSGGVRFTERVTNTGTVPFFGLILKPKLSTHQSGGADGSPRSLTCRIGNVTSAIAFLIHTKGPSTGEECGITAGLQPGSSVTISYFAFTSSKAQAAASARAGAKVVPLSLSEALAFGTLKTVSVTNLSSPVSVRFVNRTAPRELAA